MFIMKTAWMPPTLIALLLLFSCAALAEGCNFIRPSFLIDGEEQWENKTAAEIFEQASEKTLQPEARHENTLGIPLTSLVKPGTKGILLARDCHGNSLSLDVDELLSSEAESMDYALILARRDFFKIVSEQGSRQDLKKVYELKLITE